MNFTNSKLDLLTTGSLSDDVQMERRRNKRMTKSISAELSYGELNPEVVDCRIIDLSETGVRIETHKNTPVPEFLSIRFLNLKCRVRRCWAFGNEIGLAFVFDESLEHSLNASNSNSYLLPVEPLSNGGRSERRRKPRGLTSTTGQLAYGGTSPGLVDCQIVDLSEYGVRVETYVTIPVPEFFSIKFKDLLFRVRRCWVAGKQIGAEFVFDELPLPNSED